MSYQFYKMIHVVSIVIFFSMFAMSVARVQGQKIEKILNGLFGLFILVSGMGLIARIGISHAGGWPLWLKLKLFIWFIAVVGSPIVTKRFPKLKMKFFWLCILLLASASYLANFKPF